MRIVKLLLFVTLGFVFVAAPFSVSAQVTCSFQTVSPALTDLGTNEYIRINTFSPITFQPTGHIGGLYPGGSNSRPAAHEAAGIALANQIQPINGKIGMVSVGMSNTSSEFGRFLELVNADSDINDSLVVVNGALSGGTIDRWLSPAIPSNSYWSNMFQKISTAGLSKDQVQVVWLKITQLDRANFPASPQLFETRLAQLTQMLKTEFPNLKITYLSSRTRSYAYVAAGVAEPAAFENAFGIRWLIERQINGDTALNYNPDLGSTPVSYLSWGPYLWIDGMNPRSDGRIWPVTNLMSDCVHPSTAGNQAVAEMLLEFFKSDTTAMPWFLGSGVPIPTPTPTQIPSPTVMPTPTVVPTAIPTPTVVPTSMPTPTPSPASVPTPTPTLVPPSGGLVSSWSFPNTSVTDDINGCVGCANSNSSWFTPSIHSGGFNFNGTTSFLNLGNFPYLNNAPDFTVSLWVRPDFDQLHDTWRFAFSDGSNVQIYYLSNINKWRAVVRTTTGTYRLDASGISWTAGTWHNISLTYNGAQFKLYWDGQLIKTLAGSGPVAGDSGPTYLGRSVPTSNYFLGGLDDLRIYDHALTDSEAQTLFSNPGL